MKLRHKRPTTGRCPIGGLCCIAAACAIAAALLTGCSLTVNGIVYRGQVIQQSETQGNTVNASSQWEGGATVRGTIPANVIGK
jgi:glucan phosphorylase